MFKFAQIAKCNESVAEQIDFNNPHLIKNTIKGDLSIFLQLSGGALMFKMDNFQYGINLNDKIIYEDRDSQWKLILCLDADPKNCWILKINDNVELVESLVSERCKLISKKASKIIIRQIQNNQQKLKLLSQQNMVKADNKNQIANQNSNQRQYDPQYTAATLVQASKSLSKGLNKAGQFIAKGLQSLGNYFSQRVQPSSGIMLSQENKNLIKKSMDTSKKVLQVTKESFTEIFRMAKTEAGKLLDEYQQSNQAPGQNTGGNTKKNINTGIHLVANIVDGLVDGITNIGAGVAKGTNKVTMAKYGKDVKQLYNETIEGKNNFPPTPPSQIDDPNFNPTKAVIKKL